MPSFNKNMPSGKTVTYGSGSFWMQFLRHLVVLFSLCSLISGYSTRDRVHELMSRYPLIDGHNDLALQLRILHNNRLSQIDLHNVSKVATDITRLKAGYVQAQMFAVYVMCGAQDKDAVRLTLEQIDVVRRMCTEYQEFELVTSAQELQNSEMRHKIACLISIEGGHSIDSSLPALRMFYQLGVRSMALTHTCNTPWAESSSKLYNVYQRQNNSLTHFGKAVVEEMNRLGMIVDLSHTSWDTSRAVLKHSKAPVIFSHSSSYSICNHSRNVPDWLLQELKQNRGLIMVNLHSKFISCRDEANVSRVADHFDHIKKVIGAESIGIGGDFEGAVRFPKGLEDVSKYPTLIQELLQRNWTEIELAGVLRGNFLQVLKEVERVREQLSLDQPSEVHIPLEEVQNPCRLVLRPPDPRLLSSTQSPSSVAQHGPEVLCWPTGATLVREENQTVEDANSGNEHNMLGRKMCLDISSPKSMICDILGGVSKLSTACFIAINL
ncbi:dipeptidase 2 isoform X3 [Micropterus dolomieu]|uniref:dipeptidase 2 isoform X3 n=1 Tax=Micropterus dolomieu TaxID=147949 RepID=UPI001E8E9404|nr:dipeptidase 2 isoform X3 [Micropterus dolomieu]